MKQYILKRKLLAEKASQKEAEQILGRKIHNFLYGSEGYLIEENKENDWLGYFIWERDWLHKFELGDIVIGGYSVVINNW